MGQQLITEAAAPVQWGNGRLWTHALPRPWWFCSPRRFPSSTWSLPPSNWSLPSSTRSFPSWTWRLSATAWKLSATKWWLSSRTRWQSTSRLPFPARGGGLSSPIWPLSSNGPTAGRLSSTVRNISRAGWRTSWKQGKDGRLGIGNGLKQDGRHGVPGRNGGHDGQWDGWYDGWEEGQESRKESKEGCKVWSTSGCPGSWRLYGFQEFQGREIGFQLQLQFI